MSLQHIQDEIEILESNLHKIKCRISQNERIYNDELERLILSPFLSLLQTVLAKNPHMSYSFAIKLEKVIEEYKRISNSTQGR